MYIESGGVRGGGATLESRLSGVLLLSKARSFQENLKSTATPQSTKAKEVAQQGPKGGGQAWGEGLASWLTRVAELIGIHFQHELGIPLFLSQVSISPST